MIFKNNKLELKYSRIKTCAIAFALLLHGVIAAWASGSFTPPAIPAPQVVRISMVKPAAEIRQIAKVSEPAKKEVKKVIAKSAPQEPAAVPEPVEEIAEAEAAEAVTKPLYNASYLRNPAPVYPESARRNKQEGRVVLSVDVSAEGLPHDIAVASSSGIEELDDAALEAVSNWRFVPAMRGDVAIAANVRVPLEFKLIRNN